MPKKKPSSGRVLTARKKWPRGGSLKLWLECYLDCCERVDKPAKSAMNAAIRLRQLAECGFETQALKRLERLLALLDPSEVDAFVRLSLVGAEICLEALKLNRAGKYLASVEGRLPEARPANRRLLLSFVESFRVINGLAGADNADVGIATDEQIQLGRCRQQYRVSVLAGDQGKALASVRRATRLIPEIDEFILERSLILSAIKAYHRIGEDDEIIKYLTWIDRNHHTSNLDTGAIAGMGLGAIANQRAEKLIVRRLNELKTRDDSNIHFPVDEICTQLWFFIQTNESETATKLLRRALRDLPKWPGLQGGFASSGALTTLAEVLAELEGPDEALALLGHAVEAGKRETHRGFRKGSLKAANALVETPGLASAIEKANSIRSAKKRRETLIPLCVKSGKYAQVSELLDEASHEEEVHQLVNLILYQLPGGARL